MKNIILIAAVCVIVYVFYIDYAMKFQLFAKPFKRRKCDKFGCGYFGASRDGGSRKHNGMDVLTTEGQVITAPIGGKIRLFKPYAGVSYLDGIEITGKNYRVKLMYVMPLQEMKNGDVVKAGDRLGFAQSLQSKYPGISDHIHTEVYSGGIARNPTRFFPPDTLDIA